MISEPVFLKRRKIEKHPSSVLIVEELGKHFPEGFKTKKEE
jgi:hypothetical protein